MLNIIAVLGAAYSMGPFQLDVPEDWKVEVHGETEETSLLYLYTPQGDTIVASHAKIPGLGLLGRFMSEESFMEKQAEGKPPEGCQSNPEKLTVGKHSVLIYQCEGGQITATCAPDLKAILTLTGSGKGARDAIVLLLERSFK